jgi:signal transduction histidine kinase
MRFLRRPSTRQASNLGVLFLKIIALAIVYHLAVRLGLQLAYVQINTSPVWPPTGIAIAALLLFGNALWPGISLGVLLGSLLTGAPTGLAVGMAIGNTLEALAAAHLLRRFFGFHNAIDRIQDVVGLAAVGLVSTAISASIGAATLLLTGLGNPDHLGAIWSTWWIGDLLGALVVAPAILVWATPLPVPSRQSRLAEGGLVLTLLALVAWYVFSDRPSASIFHQALIYMIFPFIIWAALRIGQRGSATGVVLVSGVAIWGTVQGNGPFALEFMNDSLVLLQTFMGVVSLTALILAAATLERSRATESLRQRADELATLNDSSKTLLGQEHVPDIYKAICQNAVARLGLDAAWIETSDQGSSTPNLAAANGIPIEAIRELDWGWDQGVPFGHQEPGKLRTVNSMTTTAPLHSGFRSYASIPLVFSGRPFGILKLVSKDGLFFTQDRQLLIQSYANFGAVVIQNRWLLEEVRQSNRQLHALSQRLMQAQEKERLHLSRELHDESGQLLAGLMVQLGLLERDASQPELAQARLAGLKQTTNELQDNLHKLAVDLRPASLDHLGLVTALGQYVGDFGQQYGIEVEFEAVGMHEDRLPGDVETALFRIVQESLTNVVLHAQATHVDVLVSQHGGRVVATIEDNGVGFIPTSPTFEDHLGLFGMRERVEMLNGKFTVESAPGKGTTVNVEIRLDA